MSIRTLFAFFIVILLSCSHPQSDPPGSVDVATPVASSDELMATFTKDLDKYLQYFNDGQYEPMLNMVYPKLFELMPREQMRTAFEHMAANGMQLEMDLDKIISFSDITTIDGSQYARVFYDGDMTISLSGQALTGQSQFDTAFKQEYGVENVVFDPLTNVYTINSIKSMVAIRDPKIGAWRYIEFNNSQRKLLRELLPVRAFEALNISTAQGTGS